MARDSVFDSQDLLGYPHLAFYHNSSIKTRSESVQARETTWTAPEIMNRSSGEGPMSQTQNSRSYALKSARSSGNSKSDKKRQKQLQKREAAKLLSEQFNLNCPSRR